MNRRELHKPMVAFDDIAALPGLAYSSDVEAKPDECLIRIGLVSVGGSDGNTVAAIAQGLQFVTRTIAIDTDLDALISSGADRTVLIGSGIGRPQHPRQAFEMAGRHAQDIEAAIDDLDLVFIVAGMYGAAGKGVAPVVAETARRKHIATLGIAIIPAEWQGAHPNPRVAYGVREFQRAGASVFPIKSQSLAQANGEKDAGVSQTVRSLFASIGHAVNDHIGGIDLHDLQLVLNPGGIAAMDPLIP
ncbi:hypothetical protein BH11PSE10_BH11PSE10_08980 [soil metagenome]